MSHFLNCVWQVFALLEQLLNTKLTTQGGCGVWDKLGGGRVGGGVSCNLVCVLVKGALTV